tara:strand:- start:33446 stop:33970 length:525 start_codon:yes stop_codon:yes gene_type:complete
MKVTPLKIPDVKLIEPDVFKDERGFFYESFNQRKFNRLIGQDITFVQDNHSKSSKGVLRGLHYQEKPFAQGKLLRVIVGEIFDVVVDIRKESSTYGQWISEIISSEKHNQIWIPEGFAHGFVALKDNTHVLYKTTNFYSKDHEKTIHWSKNEFNIIWPKDLLFSISKKDSLGEN